MNEIERIESIMKEYNDNLKEIVNKYEHKKEREEIKIAENKIARLKNELEELENLKNSDANEIDYMTNRKLIVEYKEKIEETEKEKIEKEKVLHDVIGDSSEEQINKKNEIRDNEDKTRKALNEIKRNLENEMKEIQLKLNDCLTRTKEFKYEYEEGTRNVINGQEYAKLSSEYQKLTDEKNAVKKSIEKCDEKLQFFKEKDQKEVEKINAILNGKNIEQEEKETKSSKDENEQQEEKETKNSKDENEQQEEKETENLKDENEQQEPKNTENTKNEPNLKISQITINEKKGEVIYEYEDKSYNRIENLKGFKTKDYKKEMKDVYKEVKDICKKEALYSLIGTNSLYRKVNKLVIEAFVKETDNGIELDKKQARNYIRSLNDKVDFNFKLVHNLAGLNPLKKMSLNRFTKSEEKCGAIIIGNMFNKNKALESNNLNEFKYKKALKEAQKRKEEHENVKSMSKEEFKEYYKNLKNDIKVDNKGNKIEENATKAQKINSTRDSEENVLSSEENVK